MLFVQIKHFQGQLERRLRSCVHHQTSPKCSMKVSLEEFSDPDKAKTQINIVRKKLWEVIPDTVKELPWKKAENILLERLIFLGQNALKWTLITFFISSALSDVIISISRNQELMIPFGLFVGYLTADFIKDISKELFRCSEVYFTLHYSHQLSIYFFISCMLKFIFSIIDLLAACVWNINRTKDWSGTLWALLASLFLLSFSLQILRYNHGFFFCIWQMVGWCNFCGCGEKKEIKAMERFT